jgi:hypothetical protein
MQPWQAPSLEEIAMNAEIGAYQEEREREDPPEPIVGEAKED